MSNLSHARTQGLVLMAMGMLVFAGTNAQMLPAVAFWPASLVCCIGIVVFIKGNRVASEVGRGAHSPGPQSDDSQRDPRALRRPAGPNRRPTSFRSWTSAKSEQRRPCRFTQARSARTRSCSTRWTTPRKRRGDGEFVVTTDVSFPIEVQEQDSLAEQLQKLQRLKEQDIITADEFAIAKAKLLS